MKIEEIKAHRAAKVAAAGLQTTPINPDFVPLSELLIRLQAVPMSLSDAAQWLLFNWCNADKPPAWLCNGKHGIVPISTFNTVHEIPLHRLEYVFHQGHFESDGPNDGASIDYDHFGFDRQQFADFLAAQGEPLDLFCPVPDTAPAQTPAQIEKKELRQDSRLRACEAAGLSFKDYKGRLPDGVAKVANSAGVTRQAFSADVKAALKRRESAKREGVTVHRA